LTFPKHALAGRRIDFFFMDHSSRQFLRDLDNKLWTTADHQIGVPAIALPTTSLKAIRTVVANLNVLRELEAEIRRDSPADQAKHKAIPHLAALRDTLLPNLLSGEIHISNQLNTHVRLGTTA
jgi:hypothetical protein